MDQNSVMAGVKHVKTEEQSPQIGSFRFALEEARRRAREANSKKELPREAKSHAARPGNAYTGLKPARKRKHGETITGKTSPVQRSSESSSVSSPYITPTEEGNKRPFAPPKKLKRAPAKYDEM